MSTITAVQEHDAITQTIQHYITGARSGKSAEMKPAFHSGATIYGYVGPDLFSGPIQGLYDWHDQNGAAKDVQIRIASIDLAGSIATASIDLAGSIATARLEIDNWTGHRFTDMFTLLKVDGRWQIICKVFHLHP